MAEQNSLENHPLLSPLDGHTITPPLWKVEDVARYLRLKPTTVREMARRRELLAVKVGRSWRFVKSQIQKILLNPKS